METGLYFQGAQDLVGLRTKMSAMDVCKWGHPIIAVSPLLHFTVCTTKEITQQRSKKQENLKA